MPCDIGPLQGTSSEIPVVSSRLLARRTSTYLSPNLLLGQGLTQRLKGKAYLPGYHEIICLFASGLTLIHSPHWGTQILSRVVLIMAFNCSIHFYGSPSPTGASPNSWVFRTSWGTAVKALPQLDCLCRGKPESRG